MKQIYSVLTAMAVLFTNALSAQAINENFDGGLAPLSSDDWKFANITMETTSGILIAGQSLATKNLGVSSLSTPYYDFSGTIDVSFNYRISQKLNGQATRKIEIGLLDKSGSFTSLASTVLDKTSTPGNGIPAVNTFTALGVNVSGIRRFVVRVDANTGDGQAYVVIDNLTVTGTSPYHYGVTPKNTAPTAVNDMYFPATLTTVATGNVLPNDTDPNAGEAVIGAVLVTAPMAAEGTLVFNPDGSFSFTPAIGFSGGTVTFTYKAIDNGYDPATSTNTATVILSYPIGAIILPVKLVSFQGALNKNKVDLTWLIAENETAKTFEVQRSTNGTDFTTAAIIPASKKSGDENYSFTETTSSARVLYRLKMYDVDAKAEYSKTLVFNPRSTAARSLQVLTNPVKEKLVISFTSESNELAQVNIYDNVGRVMQRQALTASQGINTNTIALNGHYRSGLYIVELVTKSGKLSEKVIYSNQ